MFLFITYNYFLHPVNGQMKFLIIICKGANQVNNAIQQLSQVTSQNTASSEEMASSSEELASQAQILKDGLAIGDQRLHFDVDLVDGHLEFSFFR